MEISSLVDAGLCKNIQEYFCPGNSLYMFCLDGDYNIITEEYGSEEEKAYLKQLIPETMSSDLIDSLRNLRVENMIEYPLEADYAKVYAVAVNISGKAQLIWIVTALLEEKQGAHRIPEYMMTTTEERLYRSMEFLLSLSRQFFAAKMGEAIAQEAMRASVKAEKETAEQLHRSQAMTDIVRMLESENGFSKIVDDIIRDVCMCLDIYVGYLVQENAEHTVDMICEYCKVPEESSIASFQGVQKKELPFFDGKSYMISSDTAISGEFAALFKGMDLTAGVFLPIMHNDETVMYLCFCDRKQDRKWSMGDIKFLNDVKHVVQGIFTKRVTKNSLASSYAALEAILENAGCGIYVLDPEEGKVLYTNQKFRELFEHTIEVGKLDEMMFAQKELGHRFEETYVSLEDRWIDMNKTPIRWVDGREVSLCTVYDVTDKKNYQKKIENQANNDFLTGLYNRMRCEQDLAEFIEQSKENGREGALLYIDLDDFKHINDGLGHQYGDVLLKAIANSIRRVRGVENSCYRMGGDEFIVIVKDGFFMELGRICKDIQEIFCRPWYLKGEDYYCTMSMGVVCFPTDASDVEELIRKADLALYEAKRKGKNNVEFYNHGDETAPFRRLDLEKNIRKATIHSISEFEVYYQPIMDIEGEEDVCCGAEALARWNSAELGFISPGDFIPMAEYLGLINPIGEHILEEAALRCKTWNDMGHPEFHVNVNLSVVQLLQNDIVKRVKDVVERTGVNPHNLRLEVTESLAIDDIDRMVRILSQIKEIGVEVALDDFGTGYSSLNHIRALPIDVIKIDRCFIEHVAEDDYSEAFVKMVTDLADAIHVKVCVEGVEITNQYKKIKEIGVQMIQGYYFGKPMRLHEFEEQYL